MLAMYRGYRMIAIGLVWGIGWTWFGIADSDWLVLAVGLIAGLALVGFGVRTVVVAKARRRLEETPVPEAPDAGTFWRREAG